MTSPAELGWTARVRLPDLWELVTADGARVTFGRVVRAYDLRRTHPDVAEEAAFVGRYLRRRFESQHGTIENSYLCDHLLGGCAIVQREVGQGGRARTERRLHSVLNTPVADLVALEARCVTLADEANAALGRSGSREALLSTTDAAYSAMTRVLGAADTWADPAARDNDRVAALAAASREVADAGTRVRATIQRVARFRYFQGTLLGTVATIAVCSLLGTLAARYWTHVISPSALTAATVFGALGAVVSVFQRIATGRLVLDYQTSRGQLVELGMLRPAVGATFGAVIQFALVGGLLGGADATGSAGRAFGLFALIGFISGFSERFATDMIERAGQVISGSGDEPAPDAASGAGRDEPATPAAQTAPPPAPQAPPPAPQAPQAPQQAPQAPAGPDQPSATPAAPPAAPQARPATAP